MRLRHLDCQKRTPKQDVHKKANGKGNEKAMKLQQDLPRMHLAGKDRQPADHGN